MIQGRADTHLCRGARDFQLTIFYRLGVIEAPTDAAWKAKAKELADETENDQPKS